VPGISCTLLRAELLGAGEAALPSSCPALGLALLDSSVSGGVGIMNCVPLRLSGFFEGENSCGAGRFLQFGEGGDETKSSMAAIH